MKKRENVELGVVNLHKKSCCDESLPAKRDGEQSSENNTEYMLF